MLKIRLRPNGRGRQTSYRIVVIEEYKKRDGAYVSDLGFWKRDVKPAIIHIDKEKLAIWQKRGAKTTPAVEKLLNKHEVIARIPTLRRETKQSRS